MNYSVNKSSFFFYPSVIGAFAGDLINLVPSGAIPGTMFQIGLAIGLVGYVIYSVYSQTAVVKSNTYLFEALVFLSILAFSLIYSWNPQAGAFYLFRTIVLFIYAYLFYSSLNSISDIKKLVTFIVAISLIIGFYGLIKMLSNPGEIAQNITSTASGVKNRAVGVENDPNVFASYFLFPVFFLIAKYYSSKSLLYKGFYVLSLLIIMGAVALTYSRSVWLSIFLGGTLILVIKRDYKIPLLILGLFLVAALSSETFQLLLGTIFNRFYDLITGNIDTSNQVRIMLFFSSFDMVTSTYGLGVGNRGFPAYFMRNNDLQDAVGIYEPHNMYFQLLAEQGIVGFLFFMYLFALIGFVVWKNYAISNSREEKDINLALIATFIGYATFYQFYGGALVDARLYIVGVIIFSISNIYKTKSNKSRHTLV